MDEDEAAKAQAYIALVGEQYASKEDMDEAYQGQYDSDEQFAKETAENLGEWPDNEKWPHYCIDWEYAARELMHDYSEHNGYYFRNI